MVYRLSLLVFGAFVLSAQAPNLSGVWKADLEKSKFAGPPPANYLMVIDQQGSTLKEKQRRPAAWENTVLRLSTIRPARKAGIRIEASA